MVFLARKEIFRPLDLKVILALLWEGALARKETRFLLALTIILKTQRCWLIYESVAVCGLAGANIQRLNRQGILTPTYRYI